MEIFNKKTNEPIEVEYRPKINVSKTYKITISEVTIYEREEIEEKYFDPQTKNIISAYKYKYDISDEERENYIGLNVPTGAMVIERKSNDIYEQTKDNLDVSDLSVYINRK